ncbi:hypothetical protein [Stratiformator vulcanicus]|uniref:Calmodulin-binding protein n=1 Tax=Stratiformator vulcanicus TaxID=2527980 RepID=A0A517R7Q7_9PLAN|nr:hypothetical protein [Stratiformator vulcanicus]QDT39863.1 hypothetical protein Pan189_42750 [Stratiformator vulcanicus]
MLKRVLTTAVLAAAVCGISQSLTPSTAQAGGVGQPTDWQRFYSYPYVYYPQNFQPNVEYDSMYWRYPQDRQIPTYRSDWYNYYPNRRPYHSGHHFLLDVF